MKKDRNQLLFASVFMIIYTIVVYGYSYYKNELITDDTFNNVTNIIQFIISLIGIIYFFILSIKEKIDLNKHKVLILIFSIIFFIINIVSGILGFIVYSNLKSVKKERRELPKLEDVNDYNKYIYLFAFILCLFILFYLSGLFKGIIPLILSYISILFIMIFVFRKRLKRDIKVFREYFKEYTILVLKTWGKALLTVLILSLMISITTGIENATNQENLNKMFDVYPVFVALLAIIYAPISEELMFRGVLKKFINNKWAFILLSGFIFGLVHVIDDFQSYEELLYIFVYSALGCYLASLYYKTNNICTNIMFHFMQNALSVIGMIILYFTR